MRSSITSSGRRSSSAWRSPSYSRIGWQRAELLTLICLACACSANDFTDAEWERVSDLAGLGDPPPDPSNRYAGNVEAEHLGLRFYFDPRFSGRATLVDTLGRPRNTARAPKGEPINIACVSCHDPARGGADYTSSPNKVSIGAGWYDVNSQPTTNSAHQELYYWNGRSDSLWGQVLAVTESGVSMNGDRVNVAHVMHDEYGSEYSALFSEYPLPFSETSVELAARLEANGECMLDAGQCPTQLECAVIQDFEGNDRCVPRFPLHGKPGKDPACKFGDPKEPYNDAYDCMSAADKKTIIRAYVNFAKAIAAYEYRLISRDSPFDRWVAAGQTSRLISDEAIRGARWFVGKASCIDCHYGPLLSDTEWHNVGVPQLGEAVPKVDDCEKGNASCDCVTPANCLPFGIYDGLSRLRKSPFLRTSEWSDDPSDVSRQEYYEMALTDRMKGSWRTPTLRDCAITAPYMHDGYYATLEEVVHHYNTAELRTEAVGDPSIQIRPLELTEAEERDLVAFLGTLTGAPLAEELVRP